MSILSTATLTRLRKTYARLCSDSANVVRQVPTSNGVGGSTVKPVVMESGLKARANAMRQPKTADQAGRPVVIADWEVYLADGERDPATFDILPADAIMVGNMSFHVVTTDKGKSEAVNLTATCRRLQ